VSSIGKLLVDNINATISSRSTYAGADTTGTTTLLSRLTAARAGYMDNLNAGGVLASQADINAINQSASRRVILQTLSDYERPDSGSTVYTVEARTFTNDGVPANATVGPTLTATGATSGSLAAHVGSSTNPATGVYRWSYTVNSTDTTEPIRFDFTGTVDGDALTMSAQAQVLDLVGATWTTTDRSMLTAAYNKLPSKTYIAGSNNSDGDVQLDEVTGSLPAGAIVAASFAVDSITAAALKADAATEIGAAANTAIVAGTVGARVLLSLPAFAPNGEHGLGTLFFAADSSLSLPFSGTPIIDAIEDVQTAVGLTQTSAQAATDKGEILEAIEEVAGAGLTVGQAAQLKEIHDSI
jgi:hypothetical protein